MTPATQTDADRIADLESKVAALTALVERVAPSVGPDTGLPVPQDVDSATASRRGALKLAGAAAAGAVVAAVAGSAAPAAANNGDAMTLGQAGDGTVVADSQHQSIGQTRFDWLPLSTGAGFLFQGGVTNKNHDAEFPCALAGWTTSTPNPTGVFGRSTIANGYGVVGLSTGGDGVAGIATGGGSSSAGLRGVSGQYAIAANRSVKANLFLQPNNDSIGPSPKTPPPSRTDAHRVGEMDNVNGDLWWCVVAGSPGIWRKVSGPAAAGQLHVLASPTRCYDSRPNLPTGGGAKGPLGGGTQRTIDTKNNNTGVPVGATAVLVNVTVTNTSPAGFLALYSNALASWPGISTINWDHAGQSTANSAVVAVDASAQLKAFANANTDFLIDIVGYYR